MVGGCANEPGVTRAEGAGNHLHYATNPKAGETGG